MNLAKGNLIHEPGIKPIARKSEEDGGLGSNRHCGCEAGPIRSAIPSKLCSPPEDAARLSATYDNYVPMRCRNTAGALLEKPLGTYVQEWLEQPGKPVMFLLGEFGDGEDFLPRKFWRGSW